MADRDRQEAELTGYEYEHKGTKFLKDKGFSIVEVTQGSGDYGVDIIAKKDGERYAVQCKYYSSPVGIKAVQEVYAGMNYYHCTKAIVMTNSTFTDAAKELAKSNGVILWPKKRIVKKTGSVGSATRRSKDSSRDKGKRSRKRLVGGIVALVIVLIVLVLLLVFLNRFSFSSDANDASDSGNTVFSRQVNDDYLLSGSASRYYTAEEVDGLTKDELRLARNEIYARHGYIFNDTELQEYFESQSWYQGTVEASAFDNSVLNQYEKANINLIKSLE